jgi:hypothetical protein
MESAEGGRPHGPRRVEGVAGGCIPARIMTGQLDVRLAIMGAYRAAPSPPAPLLIPSAAPPTSLRWGRYCIGAGAGHMTLRGT